MPKVAGFSVKTFKRGVDLNEVEETWKNQKKGGGGKFLFLKPNKTYALQVIENPEEEFLPYKIHNWQERNKWMFIPCIGTKSCPLCNDEDTTIAKQRERWMCNVYDFEDKKVKVLEVNQDLMRRLGRKYKRKKNLFNKRVWEITKLPGNPPTHEIEAAEDHEAIALKKLTPLIHDLEEVILEKIKDYYGSDKSSRDEDDEDYGDEEDEDEEEEEERPKKKKKKR